MVLLDNYSTFLKAYNEEYGLSDYESDDHITVARHYLEWLENGGQFDGSND